jgi:type II secretory pathway component PulC
LPKLEEKLKQNLKESKTKVAQGVISGIVYSQDKSSAVVDGKIVRQGDLLGGIKIAKIHRDHIEFEGQGKSWTQKPGQPAASYWSK